LAQKERIVRASAEEINAMRARGESLSDWRSAECLTYAEVERNADEDDGPLAPGWENTLELGVPEPARPVHKERVVEPGTLERSQGKAKRVLDLRQKD
jgi:hypothetical protein